MAAAAASMVHAVPHSYPAPPPSFSQESTESSANTAHLSHNGMPSFDGATSLASTPTPTPPASRGHHQAIYSGVSVYEMEVNGIAVMRRRSDSWLNATQILKVAGIDKGKRTKVLEKEVLSRQHEKVQGGYGKYQGTWFSFARGVEFCRQYGVAELLRPLLDYDMGSDGVLNTPTKEQAMAAQRKRNMMNGNLDNRSPQSQSGTFFSNISKPMASAVNAISRAQFIPPMSWNVNTNANSLQARKPSQQYTGSQESSQHPNSQQSMNSDNAFLTNAHLDPALRAQDPLIHTMDGIGDAIEPPRKRLRPSSSQTQAGFDTGNDVSMIDVDPMSQHALLPEYYGSIPSNMTGLPPLPHPVSNSAMEKQQMLLSLFEDHNRTDFSNHPALLRLSNEDLEIPIDQTAHCALHWAATLGKIHILRALVAKGANIFRLNGGGETALMRAAMTVNNFQGNTFSEVLKILGPSIEVRDGRGQTVLHHIVSSSAIHGRPLAMRSYLDSILLYVVGNSNAPNSQQVSFDNGGEITTSGVSRPIGLGRFMSDVVNAKDVAGDTALNCAAKIGNSSIIQQLKEIGADPTIPNRRGLRPCDVPGVDDYMVSTDVQPNSQTIRDEAAMSKFDEAHKQLMTTLMTVVDDAKKQFSAERQKKQMMLDQALATLRENNAMLLEERNRLQTIQRKSDERKNLRRSVAALRKAHETMKKTLDSRAELKTNIKIGEADAGLEIVAAQLPSPSSSSQEATAAAPASFNTTTPSSGEKRKYIDSLPPTEILEARTKAYEINNERLEKQVCALQGQSAELEAQLKKVVSICAGIEEERVEGLLPGLLTAVEMEEGEGLDAERVLELLRRLDGEVGGGKG
ncbi:MAG: hypothetical protein Q9220_003801 [cf. Caloplaca sp. 1 TL-2023]